LAIRAETYPLHI